MNDDRKGPMTLEGHIEISEEDNGYYEINMGGVNVAEWATDKIFPWIDGKPPNVKAVLMIEDTKFINAQGAINIRQSHYGYSSWTPGTGPLVYIWDSSKMHDITDALEANPGRNAILSLEIV